MLHKDIVRRTMEKEGLENVSVLISTAFRATFKKRIKREYLLAYTNLYFSGKTVPDWVWLFCIQRLNFPDQFLTELSAYPGAVRQKGEDKITKCDHCGVPLVYEVHGVRDNPDMHFCSQRCKSKKVVSLQVA